MLNEFIAYLNEQIGQPYLWGGQHTRLTPENYVRIIEKKEAGRGGYKGGPTYAEAAIDYCKRKFQEGATVLYAYDCSGLGCYWLCNLAHLYRCDVNANTMMNRCTLQEKPPKRGWWVFRLDDSGKATHIGYMVDDEWLVEAKGRKYGVVVTKFAAKDWSVWGIPDVFYDEIAYPEPVPPEPPEPPVTEQYVEVIGKSVRVRSSDSVLGKTQFIAHKGDTFPLVCIAPSGWYQVDAGRGESYITSKTKYTKLVET